MMQLRSLKIYVAGHTGLVGRALVRRFSQQDGLRLVTANRAELDLIDIRLVEQFLTREEPDVLVIAAGRVGGILANSTYPAEFIYENLMTETNLIHSAWKAGVKRVLNFGSSCMYPRKCPQPMSPGMLMTGKVEPTSEPYAVAKWAGLTLCSSYSRQYGVSFVTAIPCTVYGPGDSFDAESSHVISALIRRFHEAKELGSHKVTLWGSGQAQREFLYVDDLAEACELLLRVYERLDPVNIGSGTSHTIREIASAVADVVGFNGEICWDSSQPEGAPAKLLDSAVMREMGWSPRTNLQTGLTQTYRWFLEHETTSVRKDSSCVS